MTLEYSTISHKIIHSFEVDKFWLLNLMKWVLFSKSMIYGNDYLTFYITKWVRKEIQVTGKGLHKYRRKCYFY